MMISRGGRAIGLLPQLRLQSFGGCRAGVRSNCERVTAFYNDFQYQQSLDVPLRFTPTIPAYRRTYANRPVSRPKAHTGRTTAAAARKAPTTSSTKAAKKPAPKTKAAKAKPKAKSKAKSKPVKRAKPKPKQRTKVLTGTAKQAAIIKQLKTTSLKPPHNTPHTAWMVFSAEALKRDGSPRDEFGQNMKRLSEEFRQLTPERLEYYNHIANQNKAANEKAYRQWVESYTPTAIYEANLARKNLRRRKVKGSNKLTKIQDHRQVKPVVNSFARFHKDRFASGDLKGLKVSEAARLIAREWKGLSASEKKPYEDAQKEDMTRYIQESKTVYNKDVRSSKKATSAV